MKVTILHPVIHDGKPVDVGAVIDLDKKVAQALIDCSSAEEGGSIKRRKAEADNSDQAGDDQGAAEDDGAADTQA